MKATCRLAWSVLLATWAGIAGAQMRALPIAGAGAIYEMEKFSLTAPQGNGWFELKRDRRTVYFGKKLASRTHSFIATAISAPVHARFSAPEGFRDYVGQLLVTRGDDRHAANESRTEVDGALGHYCVRYHSRTTDRNAVYAKGMPLLMETHGITCLHPDDPGLSVDISYTERGGPAEASAELRAAGEKFIRSLKFTSR